MTEIAHFQTICGDWKKLVIDVCSFLADVLHIEYWQCTQLKIGKNSAIFQASSYCIND